MPPMSPTDPGASSPTATFNCGVRRTQPNKTHSEIPRSTPSQCDDRPMDWEREADRFAAQALAGNEPTAWFERLYASGVAGEIGMPWDTEGPRPALAEWATGLDGHGRRAIVVGA